jgi:hypothetical protein
MSISKILLFTLIALASTKNVVLIGDSRAVGIGVYLFGFQYSHIAPSYGTGSNIIGTSAKSYGGHSCKVVAETGASFATFVNTAKSVNKGVTTVLSGSASGTIVLLWLGVNNLNADSTGSYYKSLANKYKKLKFYVIPVTGVTSKSGISNASIKSFNSKLNSMVKSSGLSNLKYKNILQNNDPTKVAVNGKVVLTVDASTTDAYGLHYKTSGYKAIFNAMVSGL